MEYALIVASIVGIILILIEIGSNIAVRKYEKNNKASQEKLDILDGKYEIERRWLIDEDSIPSEFINKEYIFIDQYYNPMTGYRYRKTARPMKNEDTIYKYYESIKYGLEDPVIRMECEYEIPGSEYSKNIGSVYINKTRHITNKDSLKYELDEFNGKYKSLYIMEIEFDTIEDACKYRPLSWFGPEITDLKTFRNKNMAMSKNPEEILLLARNMLK
jgi:CYTH domain-containing protein